MFLQDIDFDEAGSDFLDLLSSHDTTATRIDPGRRLPTSCHLLSPIDIGDPRGLFTLSSHQGSRGEPCLRRFTRRGRSEWISKSVVVQILSLHLTGSL